MPVGWRRCPKMGLPVWRLIPMKVPLGPAFDRFIPDPAERFTVEDAVEMTKVLLAGREVRVPDPAAEGGSRGVPAQCSMVVDLTNSNRYYRRETFEEAGFYHVKVSWAVHAAHLLQCVFVFSRRKE